MMMATPARQIRAPVMSHRSGRKPSSAMPQARDPATKMPPLAARIRPEVGVGLQGRNEAVEAKRDDAGAHPDPAAVFTEALPDQPRATDLGDGGEDEQQDRTRHGHGAEPYEIATFRTRGYGRRLLGGGDHVEMVATRYRYPLPAIAATRMAAIPPARTASPMRPFPT